MKIVAVSGYFDPIHVAHLEYLKMSKKLGDKLVVIVNNNYQCILKKGKPFMDEKDRLEIVKSLEMVDEVFLSIDKDKTVCASLGSNFKTWVAWYGIPYMDPLSARIATHHFNAPLKIFPMTCVDGTQSPPSKEHSSVL